MTMAFPLKLPSDVRVMSPSIWKAYADPLFSLTPVATASISIFAGTMGLEKLT
jgi:hypothetical protein